MRVTYLYKAYEFFNYLLPIATLIYSAGRDLYVGHGSLFIYWDGKKEVTWGKK